MITEFKMQGEWFLPSSRNRRAHGTLNFHPQDGADLEVHGNLTGEDFLPYLKNEEIILGITTDNKEVTLFKCSIIGSSSSTAIKEHESGKFLFTYSISYILIGLHALSSDDLMFNYISAEIFNLDEWVGESGFIRPFNYLEMGQKKIFSIEYHLPEPIEFELEPNVRGRFNFNVKRSALSRFQKTATITQKVDYQVLIDSPKNIDELLNYIATFQNFLALALYKSTFPVSITLQGENHLKVLTGKITYLKSIKLFYSSSRTRPNDKIRLDFEMLFNYGRIANDFPTIIKNWHSKYEILKPAFDLVFEQFYKANTFSTNTFLNLAQSAETFHARVHNHKKIPKEIFNRMKEEILQSTSPKYHEWLKEQFKFSNNLNLQARLEELTHLYSNKILDTILGDKAQFVLNVKHSRNYYTHYSKDGEKKALKGKQLYYLSEKLKVLLVCCFLIEVGFDKEKLSTCLDEIKWKHFSHLSD